MNLDYVTVTINITPPLADLTSNFKLLLLAQFQVADDRRDKASHFRSRQTRGVIEFCIFLANVGLRQACPVIQRGMGNQGISILENSS
ncbi:hypothetical protein FEMY_24620 [Ferrovum myxofaciens]|uniref:Uncharacterized protein n=1 Tax=Ferrovum myxofaciens TaxID=416213 RepID=A0A149VUX9_9PROT|nr:hypothetical protein FEMY_24620 [Ferrovum myxofaciens]